uniref:Uncharacterized protein n=1 Tax=Anguilla anguilla TaxID=7936 RepID=A0A0E9RDG9_ANGAN
MYFFRILVTFYFYVNKLLLVMCTLSHTVYGHPNITSMRL